MAYRGDRDRGGAPPQKIYIGNLSSRTREDDIRSAFVKYGDVVDVVLKYEFAFVEMESRKDMEDAIDALDQHEMHGRRWLVEPARRGPVRNRGDISFRGGGGGRFGGDRGGSGMLRRPSGLRPNRGQYRIQILGLSSSTSWQDLKDWGRTAGNSVVFGDVMVEGGRRLGVIEYHNKDDYLYAVDHLNGDKLHGKTLSVYKDGEAPLGDDRGHRGRRDRSRSRSRSRSRERRRPRSRRHGSRERSRRKDRKHRSRRRRSRSRSRSSSRSSRGKDSKSRSRSRSRSADKGGKSKSRSRSPSKSKSRSPSN